MEMKQLHRCNLYKPLESHIFVEEKKDGKIKARKVVGGNSKETTSNRRI